MNFLKKRSTPTKLPTTIPGGEQDDIEMSGLLPNDEGSSLQEEKEASTTTMSPSSCSRGYSRLTKEYYLTMAFCQAGCLASLADVTTQTLEGTSPMDLGHIAAMATVASTMSGLMNAIWLRQLEQAFPGTDTKQVIAKTLIHAVIIASIINSALLVGVPLFSQHVYGAKGFSWPPTLEELLQGWSVPHFVTLTKLEIIMFIPYNTLAFKYGPPSIRPLTHAAVGTTFNIAVSAVTLGYFDVWMAKFWSVFGNHSSFPVFW